MGISFLSIVMILYGIAFEVVSVSSFWLFGDWWVFGFILFAVGTPFAIASIILGFGLWKGKNSARNTTIVLIYIEIFLVVAGMIGMQTVTPFPFSLQIFGIYSLIPLLYIIGKDAIGLYYLSRPNVKSYFGQVKKQTGDG
jgi:hypothetical protein